MIDTGMGEQRAEWHLDNWAAWMRGVGLPQLWYPGRSPMLGRSGSSDFDALVANADTRCAAAVDAIIEGLPRPFSSMLHCVKLGCCPHPVRPDKGVYEQARASIAKGLTARGFW